MRRLIFSVALGLAVGNIISLGLQGVDGEQFAQGAYATVFVLLAMIAGWKPKG